MPVQAICVVASDCLEQLVVVVVIVVLDVSGCGAAHVYGSVTGAWPGVDHRCSMPSHGRMGY